MASWGDINAALNGLVREGVISGFKTNRGDKSHDVGLHVRVTAPEGESEDSVRAKIMNLLEPLDDEVTVSVGELTAG